MGCTVNGFLSLHIKFIEREKTGPTFQFGGYNTFEYLVDCLKLSFISLVKLEERVYLTSFAHSDPLFSVRFGAH